MRAISLSAFLFVCGALFAQEGALDPSFGQGGRTTFGFDGTANAQDPTSVALQPDGKILVAGFGFQLAGVANAHICIARLLPDGSPDPEFSGDGKAGFAMDAAAQFNIPRVVRVLDNGKILLLASAGNDLYFLRLLANGDPDQSFGAAGVLKIKRPLGTETVFFTNHAMQLLSNGKILTFYRQTYTGLGATIQVVSRFNANGSPDLTFGGTGRVVVDSSIVATGQAGAFANVQMALLSGNKVLLAGDTTVQTSPSILLVKLMRLNTDGSFDQSFGSGGKVSFPGINMLTNALQIDGSQNAFVCGMIGGTNAVVRIKPNGSLDSSYGLNGVATGGASNFVIINAGLVLSNGQSILGGITSGAIQFQTGCKSFDSKGVINASFGTAGISDIPKIGDENILRAMAVQADGKVVLVGKRKAVSSVNVSDFEVMRLNAASSAAQDIIEENDFQIWPNPAIEVLNISLSGILADATLSLFSADGKLLRLLPAQAGTHTLDLTSLPVGTYFIQIEVPGKMPQTKTILKIH